MRDVMFGRQNSKQISKFTGQPSFASRTVSCTVAALSAGLLCSVASGALAQSTPSAAQLAIEAAVPKTEPAAIDLSIAAPASIVKDTKAVSAATKPGAPPTETAKAEPAKVEPATSEPAKVEPAKTEAAKTEVTKTEAAKTEPTSSEPAAAETAKTEPAKVSTVAAADQPVADRLREALSARTVRYFDRRNEKATVEKFYAGRDFGPIWSESGVISARGKAAIARLKSAGSDGLNPSDYPTPDFASATTAEALADAELKLTASVLDYARHAQGGRMHYSRVSADILYPEHNPEPADILADLSSSKDAAASLDAYNPPHKGYLALKSKLAELRGETEKAAARIESGQLLKYTPERKTKKQTTPEVVMEDPRVPTLRVRLGMTENPDSNRFDQAVVAAVRKFQSNADIKVTGQLDEPTIRALNAPKRDRQIDLILVNMERWRWLQRDLGAPSLGNAYVMLNIPDFTLRVMQKGAPVWTTRVVVGKPGKQATPEMTETMKYITVNPTWNVPPSIIYNEYLPALQQDPTVLQRMGLRLSQNRDGSIHISQPPGESNALGRIRFNFPNKFLVYQHDTPDKHLFAHDSRAYSHGCMRVQNPDQYAETLLGIVLPNENYTAARIRSMYGNQERDIRFPTPVPVHIVYHTAFVDDSGTLQTRKDIYSRDSRLLAVLKSGDGRDMETPVAHAQPNYSRPPAQIPRGVAMADGYSSDGGGSFLERLFGGGPQPPPPAPIRQQQRRVITR